MTTDNRPAITPIVGKRAIMRNGKKTGIIKTRPKYTNFVFIDDCWRVWTYEGLYRDNGKQSKLDIVAIDN